MRSSGCFDRGITVAYRGRQCGVPPAARKLRKNCAIAVLWRGERRSLRLASRLRLVERRCGDFDLEDVACVLVFGGEDDGRLGDRDQSCLKIAIYCTHCER